MITSVHTLCTLGARKSHPAFEPNPHALLHMPEPIAAQMLAAIPARHDDNLAHAALALQHPQDHHARPALAVVVLQRRPAGQNNPPRIMRGFGEFLVLTQQLNEIRGIFGGATGPAGYRVF